MINIIVAFDKNRLIGKNNELPWYYKEDLQYFKKMTLNKKILFGKTTFYSVYNRRNRLLPQRKTLVLSHSTIDIPDVKTYHNTFDILDEFLNSKEEVFVCGGKSIYEIFLKYANKLYITYIDHEYQGDCYFPEIDYSQYDLLEKNNHDDLTFCVYKKKGEIV